MSFALEAEDAVGLTYVWRHLSYHMIMQIPICFLSSELRRVSITGSESREIWTVPLTKIPRGDVKCDTIVLCNATRTSKVRVPVRYNDSARKRAVVWYTAFTLSFSFSFVQGETRRKGRAQALCSSAQQGTVHHHWTSLLYATYVTTEFSLALIIYLLFVSSSRSCCRSYFAASSVYTMSSHYHNHDW